MRIGVAVALVVIGATWAMADTEVVVNVDRGEDRGQNFGSLFEARTTDGKFVVGAGFAGAYNTRFRHDRHTAHFFVRPTDATRDLKVTRTSRPNDLAGTYLFDFEGQVYAADPDLRVWRESDATWQPSPDRSRVDTRVGRHLLSFDGSTVILDGETVLEAPAEGNYTGFYYAQGYLVFYHIHRPGDGGYRDYTTDAEGYSKLIACPWKPGDGPVDLAKATVETVPVVGEFPYAYGQLGDQVISCSNIGGVYALRDGQWRTLVEGSMEYSYQVYAGFTYYDQLLLGQYPSGDLFSFDGETVTQIEGWPPVMDGVSTSSREAQTIVVYGGDLYVGVWPWGEVWRYQRDTDTWTLARRMFTHPEPTNATLHPYEDETRALGGVANQWGQRVTSMVPVNDTLFVSTSAKWPCEWEPKFGYLGSEAWKEYGTVTHLRVPGHLSAPVAWTDGATELRFTITGDDLRIAQDGKDLGAAKLDGLSVGPLAEPTWGNGVYGVFTGTSVTGTLSGTE
ncbi:MAG: hypothetical protein AMXMBFR82_35660 [Candidatus Hydrogenedentota bacterium]